MAIVISEKTDCSAKKITKATGTLNNDKVKFKSLINSVSFSLSRVQLFATMWHAACQASLSITNCQCPPKLMSIESVMHPTISSSFVSFSSCPQSFRASGPFPMSQLFTSGGQSTRVSASTWVLPMNTQDWSPLGWTDWISLQAKGLSRVFSNTTVQKHQFFSTQLSLEFNSHIHTWPLEKPKLWLDRSLLTKWCLCFSICYVGWSWLFIQGTNLFQFHGCSHHLQWFWSPQNSLSLFPHLFAMTWWDQMPRS